MHQISSFMEYDSFDVVVVVVVVVVIVTKTDHLTSAAAYYAHRVMIIQIERCSEHIIFP